MNTEVAEEHGHTPRKNDPSDTSCIGPSPGYFARSWLRSNILLGSLRFAAFGTLLRQRFACFHSFANTP